MLFYARILPAIRNHCTGKPIPGYCGTFAGNTKGFQPGRKRAYSTDICWRVILQRIGMDLPFFKIAQNLNIASSTAHRIYKRFEETGEVERKKPQSRENLRNLSARDKLFIIGFILGNPVLYLEEICREVDKVLGKQVSAPTVCHLHGFTRKKVQAIAKQQSDKFRGAFIAEMHCYSRDQLVWVDEMGCDTRDYVRRYGHALRGHVPVCRRLLYRGQRYSSIAALSSDGIVALESHTGSTMLITLQTSFMEASYHRSTHTMGNPLDLLSLWTTAPSATPMLYWI